MTTIAAIKNDGNIRCNSKSHDKNKSLKVHSPKIRLRLQEACDNSDKAKISMVKYSLNPSNSYEDSNLKVKENKNANYLSEPIVNRNKICQMDKIMFPSASDKYQNEKPVPRCVGKESLSYLTRNRGSLLIVGSGEGRRIPDEIHIRCPSKEAEDNLLKGRGLGMMNVLQHSTDFREDHPVPRVRDDDAAEISKKNHYGSMCDVMNQNQQNYPVISREPRCPTAEALDTWKKSQGDSMSAVMGKKIENDQNSNILLPKKRVKDEDGNSIEPSSSNGMSQVMNASKDTTFSAPTYERRVRLDGKENADKGRGTLTNDIYNYNKVDPNSIPHPEPRVYRQGKEIADSSRGFLTKQLMQKYGQYPKDPKPKARVSQYSLKIARQSQGGAMRDALCPPRQAHSKRHVRSAHK